MSENKGMPPKAISKKALLVSAIYTMREGVYNSEPLELLIHTAYGFITGEIVDEIITTDLLDEKLKESGTATIDNSFAIEIRDKLIADAIREDPDIKFLQDSACLFMKNVKVYNSNLREPVLTTNQLSVFIDQVIGVSLVPKMR